MKHLKVLTKKAPQGRKLSLDTLQKQELGVYGYECVDTCGGPDTNRCSGFSPVTDICGADYAACSGQFSLDMCSYADYAACVSGGQGTGRDSCGYDYAGCNQTSDTDCSYQSGDTDIDGCSWEYGPDTT